MIEKKIKVKNIIEGIIKKNFPNDDFSVTDVSHQHKGHSQNTMSSESHFVINITSNKFNTLSRLDRQKFFLQVLGEDIIKKVHSISLKLQSKE